jgi:hypothetical protein
MKLQYACEYFEFAMIFTLSSISPPFFTVVLRRSHFAIFLNHLIQYSCVLHSGDETRTCTSIDTGSSADVAHSRTLVLSRMVTFKSEINLFYLYRVLLGRYKHK